MGLSSMKAVSQYREAQFWEGFLVGLQQEGLSGAVVAGLCILRRTWVLGLTLAAVLPPLLLQVCRDVFSYVGHLSIP